MSALRRFLDPDTARDVARLAGIVLTAFCVGVLFGYGWPA